jgi:hypothetical protein
MGMARRQHFRGGGRGVVAAEGESEEDRKGGGWVGVHTTLSRPLAAIISQMVGQAWWSAVGIVAGVEVA